MSCNLIRRSLAEGIVVVPALYIDVVLLMFLSGMYNKSLLTSSEC